LSKTSIYEGRLFCFVCRIEIFQTRVSLATLFIPLESSEEVVHQGWLYNGLTYNGEVIEYSTTFSLKIHLNQN